MDEDIMTVNVDLNRFSSSYLPNAASVDIIIPFRENYGSVSSLINKIFSTVSTNRYQITLLDDGSQNDSFISDINKSKIPGIVCMRHDASEGMGSAINSVLKNRKNNWIPWICIMHSDVLVDGINWLSSLGESMLKMKSNGIKMISPRTNSPGESLISTFKTNNLDKRNVIANDYVLKDDEYLSLYCALCHKDLFRKIGYFKEVPGIEALEFSHRMKQHNYKQAICASSWVYHDGSGTINKLTNKEKELLRKNKQDYLMTIKNEKSST